MRINHNLPAINGHRNLLETNSILQKTMERLSSGYRINRAADDAAGLAITETMRSQIRDMSQAGRNSQDAISLIQTADGALGETQSILNRMKELAIQAANDTYSANDRIELQKEIDSLKNEVKRIANSTNFNKKNLLDGSSAVLASTDKASTQVMARGDLADGCKTTVTCKAGSPKCTTGTNGACDAGTTTCLTGSVTIEMNASVNQTGQAEIQKSSIFKNNHVGDTVQQLAIDESQGLGHVSATAIAIGDYRVSTSAAQAAAGATGAVAQFRAATGSVAVTGFVISGISFAQVNASIALKVLSASGQDHQVFEVKWYQCSQDGSYALSNGVVKQYQAIVSANAGPTTFTLSGVVVSLNCSGMNLKAGDEGVINIKASSTVTNDQIVVRGANTANNNTWVSNSINWAFNSKSLNDMDTRLYFFSLDSNGTIKDGNVTLNVENLSSVGASGTTFTFAEGFGLASSLDTKLSDIDQFYDPNGRSLLNNPQQLTLIQGDGTRATVTLFESDTLYDVRAKLNDAICNRLGQGDRVSLTEQNRFVSYVTKADTVTGSTQMTEGTFVLRSAVAGSDGEITFIGDEQVLNALGLSVAQKATETNFNIDLVDPNDPTNYYVRGFQVAGNMLEGVISRNIDVKIDSNADTKVVYNTTSKTFELSPDNTQDYRSIIQLVGNAPVFQIGGTEGQNMSTAIGSMNPEALGINNILITSIDAAVKTISKIDYAINRISTQRSSLGAIQNRLEKNIASLGTVAENLSASESRLRDSDMAKEIMKYARLNILTQTTMAMLSQANLQPQQVLQLLGQ